MKLVMKEFLWVKKYLEKYDNFKIDLTQKKFQKNGETGKEEVILDYKYLHFMYAILALFVLFDLNWK